MTRDVRPEPAPEGPGNPRPRVVVLIPVYNGQKDFDLTLESLSRSSEPCDVVVVDDGSKPPVDVSRYRVHLIRLGKNIGPIPAANTGLRYILTQDYEFVARSDAGDLSAENRLARQIAYMDNHPECMLVGSDTDVFRGDDYQFTLRPPRDTRRLQSGLREHSWLLHSTLLFRTAVLRELGVYSEKYLAAEDHEICLRIATSHAVGVVPETLVTTIFTAQGITFQKRRVQLISRIRIQLLYFRWTALRSWTGLFKSLLSITLPASFVRWLKRTFLYDRMAIPAARVGSAAVATHKKASGA
jgi:glycosyltransferase involved in cell wall biosynthesis